MTFSGFLSVACLVALGASACASRDVPREFPRSSAASPSADEAEPAVVTRALAGDPPLPGTPTAGWSGLSPPGAAEGASGDAEHAGHHHHGGTPAPSSAGAAQDGAAQQSPAPQPTEPPPAQPAHDHGAHHGH